MVNSQVIQASRFIIFIFGIFLIGAGFLMLIKPKLAHTLLKKAGSTNLINYTEITLRMVPAAAMVLYADLSRFPEIFKLLGWFMIATSIVLYFVPRRLHHQYALWCAECLPPKHLVFLSFFSILFGCAVIYAVY